MADRTPAAGTADSTAPRATTGEAPATTHWARIGESTFAGGLWLLYLIYRLLGRLPFRLCLYPVVVYYWATRRVARHASQEYLERLEAACGVFALHGHAPGLRHSLRHFLVFAEVILDKLLLSAGRYRAPVTCQGHQALLDGLRQGRGAILVTAHIGCIELCRTLAEQQPEMRLTILVHTRHAERFNRLLRRHAPHAQVQLMQVTAFDVATAMLLSSRVAQGECIAIAGDRVPVHGGKITHASFLGHAAPFPAGPYIMAAVLKCPLYFMGCIHDGAGYAVRFVRLADSVALPRGQRDDALAHYAGLFATQLETCLASAPYDWFNFFPFWTQDRATPLAPLSSEQTDS
ncbi:acyltransferase [Imbroritus primus]|uniref:Acyltransferase n=2 Tax=Imbroritus primus TaxID=3058603 RepID=A0ACD3SUG9_9BURK|nr:acyltransferase [Burkholderiaceae bacterium PBA]